MGDKMEVNRYYFTQIELKAIVMGLLTIQEDAEAGLLTKAVSFNKEAKQTMQEMYDSSTSALVKLAEITNKGVMFAKIDPYIEGDENEFIDKDKKSET